MKTPTLADIARRAEVSRMTVSLALRNDPRVKAATKQRVCDIAVEMGYRINPLISALMASIRTRRKAEHRSAIAFVVEQENLEAPTLKQYVIGARKRALELGFRLDVFSFGGTGLSASRLDDILYARGVVGVLLAPLASPGRTLQFNWERYAVAALGYSMPSPRLHRIVNHQFRTMVLALNSVWQLGYRRPGLAMRSADDDRVDHNWTGGFLTFCHHQGVKRQVPLLLTKSWTRDVFAAWYKKHRPDVVITLKGSDDVRPWLESMGARIPRDAGLAIVNWEPSSGAISGVDQNSAGVGAAGIDVVVSQLHQNERGVPSESHVTLIEGKWIAGRTLRKRPAAKPAAGASAAAGWPV